MGSLEFETLLYEKGDGIAWLTLNRPHKLNAMNYVLYRELRVALDDIATDEEVRVAVLRGSGRAFSVGADLTFGKPDPAQAHLYDERDFSHLVHEAVWGNPKPIIASVQGYCLARGGDLAGFCDLTIAADDAEFGYPILWQTPSVPKSIWPWTVGPKLTKELVMTGRHMSAAEAREHGLVNQVVPRADLERVTLETATLLANGADKRPQKAEINKIFEDAMGLNAALLMQWRPDRATHSKYYGGDDPVNVTFRRIVAEEGLAKAREWRELRMRGQAEVDR